MLRESLHLVSLTLYKKRRETNREKSLGSVPWQTLVSSWNPIIFSCFHHYFLSWLPSIVAGNSGFSAEVIIQKFHLKKVYLSERCIILKKNIKKVIVEVV